MLMHASSVSGGSPVKAVSLMAESWYSVGDGTTDGGWPCTSNGASDDVGDYSIDCS